MAEDVKKTVKFAAVIGYLVTAAAVIALPVVLVSQQGRSDYFWHRIIWTEFLALIAWGYFGGFLLFTMPGGSKTRGLGGILPASGVTIGLYVAISFVLVVAFPNLSSKFHVTAQIALLVCLVVVSVFLQFARAGAVAGAEPIPQGLRSPQHLSGILKAHQDRIFSTLSGQNASGDVRKLHDTLKSLRETIEYSLPHVGSIGASPDYRDFVAQTERLCADLENLRPDSAEPATTKKLCDTTDELRSKVNHIALLLKVSAA